MQLFFLALQVGNALGFLLPPIFVPNSVDKNEIAQGLKLMFYLVASICSVIFFLIVFGKQ